MPTRTSTFVSSSIEDLSTAPLVVVAVTRQRRADSIEVGCFLIDSTCLGIKNAWLEVIHPDNLEERKADLFDDGCLAKSAAWGRKFVESARDYAKALGFKPHSDYKKAARVFGGICSDDCDDNFEFGYKGKPFYVQGPHESTEKAERIVRHLTARCGEDGFRYILEDSGLDDQVDEFLLMAQDGNFSAAEAGIERLHAKFPESAVVHYGLGVVRALQKDSEGALFRFNEAIRLDPEMGRAWFNKGVAHKELLQTTPMTIALRKAVSLAGEDDEYIDGANEIIATMARMARDEFGIDLDTYLESGALYDKAWESIDRRQWEAGLRGMKEVVRLNPRSYQAYGNIGLCLLQMNRREESKKAYEKSLELNPEYEPALNNLKILTGRDWEKEEIGIPIKRVPPRTPF